MHELHPSKLRLGVIGAPLLAAALLLAGCSVEPSGPPTAPEPRGALSVALRGPDLAAAIAAQERHTPGLLAIGGVVGTAVGLDQAGEPVVKVFTVQPGVRGIPSHLDGDVAVAVEVTGMFWARSDPTARQRPAPVGFSVGHPDITAGTIGARVTKGGNVYVLSNNHVLANSNDAQLNDSALQPGPYDGGTDPADRIGGLSDFQVIKFDGSNNTMDAAIAISSTADLSNSTPTDDGYGTPNSAIFGDANNNGFFDNKGDLLNLGVQKYGRTTKLTHGTVTEINVTVTVCYEGFAIFCTKSAKFVDQLSISDGTFSDGGDSGSLIVSDDSGKNPVGLLFAGSSTRTIANRIDLVLDRFNVTVDGSGATEPDPVTDIAVTAVDAPSSVTKGDDVAVTVTVGNVGNQNVTSNIVVTLNDATDGGVTIGSQSITGGLAAGASTTLNFTWDTDASSLGNHTLTASHDFADDDAGNNSLSTIVTVNEPGTSDGTTMHVGDLDGSSTSQGSTWTAIVTITVHDGAHAAVSGATVSGSFSNGTTGSASCTTNGSGTCPVSKSGIPKRTSSVTFTVSNVTHATLTYDNVVNHDPDGDSNGTAITVSKP